MKFTLEDSLKYDYSKNPENKFKEYEIWPPKDYVPDNSSVFVIPEEYRKESEVKK